eukprot:5569595-Pyramimonas_sp.AAC.1
MEVLRHFKKLMGGSQSFRILRITPGWMSLCTTLFGKGRMLEARSHLCLGFDTWARTLPRSPVKR